MISRIFSIIGLVTISNLYFNPLLSAKLNSPFSSSMTQLLKDENHEQLDNLIKIIGKQKYTLQGPCYQEVFTWYFTHKKFDKALLLVQAMPCKLFNKKVSSNTSLGYWLLKQSITLQLPDLLDNLVKKISLFYLKQHITYKDQNGFTLIDYAHQTHNKEIIEYFTVDNLYKIHASDYNTWDFKFIARIIGCAFTLLIAIPIVLLVAAMFYFKIGILGVIPIAPYLMAISVLGCSPLVFRIFCFQNPFTQMLFA